MRINNVVRITSGNIGRNVTFTRAPKKGKEEIEYTRDNRHALDYLGVKNLSLILHGTCFPAKQNGYDMQIGTPINAEEMRNFQKLHGFNLSQLGPNGKLGEHSPYTSSVFEKNPMFIDFNSLKTPEYASILSEKEIASVLNRTKTTGENYARTDFELAKENTDELIDIAYKNYKTKLAKDDKDALRLKEGIDTFIKENGNWLPFYAIANVLSIKNGTDYYPNWPKSDQELISKAKKIDVEATKETEKLIRTYREDISKYILSQYIIDKQTKADVASQGNFGYISDLEVGVSLLDELVFKDVFLSSYKMGCPDGGPMNSPQLWGFCVVDPNKLFNRDGSLGPAGEFLKAKLKNGLAGSKNIRIDHVFGLINPWIYKPEGVRYKSTMQNGKQIYYPDAATTQGVRMCNSGLDPKGNFKRIIPEIVIPTMREMGVNPQDVVWEDLGWDESGVSQEIIQENRIPGIKCLQWLESAEARKTPNATSYVTCHDNPPASIMRKTIDPNNKRLWESEYLSRSLVSSPNKAGERLALKRRIDNDPRELIKAKFADLFRTTKNIQISFMDFFGIDKTYNVPGTSGGENWTLRLNPDYQDTYYKSLENNTGALNMPEILKMAVKSKFEEKPPRTDSYYQREKQEVETLLAKLEHWSQVLKEKE